MTVCVSMHVYIILAQAAVGSPRAVHLECVPESSPQMLSRADRESHYPADKELPVRVGTQKQTNWQQRNNNRSSISKSTLC